MSIEFVAQLALLARGWDRWVVRSERVWAAWRLFGNEFAVFVKGMYVELFICCVVSQNDGGLGL